MYKHIEDPENCLGMTVEKFTRNNIEAVILFTNKTYIKIEVNYDSFNDELGLDFSPFNFGIAYPNPFVITSGVITDLEHKEIFEEQKRLNKEERAKQERKRYEVLKQKFEAKS